MMKTHPLLQHFWKKVQFTYIPKLHLMSLCTNGELNPQYVPIVHYCTNHCHLCSSLIVCPHWKRCVKLVKDNGSPLLVVLALSAVRALELRK